MDTATKTALRHAEFVRASALSRLPKGASRETQRLQQAQWACLRLAIGGKRHPSPVRLVRAWGPFLSGPGLRNARPSSGCLGGHEESRAAVGAAWCRDLKPDEDAAAKTCWGAGFIEPDLEGPPAYTTACRWAGPPQRGLQAGSPARQATWAVCSPA